MQAGAAKSPGSSTSSPASNSTPNSTPNSSTTSSGMAPPGVSSPSPIQRGSLGASGTTDPNQVCENTHQKQWSGTPGAAKNTL